MDPNQHGPEVDRQVRQMLRGAVDCVDEATLRQRVVASLREGRALRVKLGMDPTAPDIHLGHAVVLRKLRQFQDLGHEALLLIGGATAMLGDPTGRDRARPQLSAEQVETNARTYLDQALKILSRDSLTIVNNADWLLKFDFADMLRLCSRMTVARMVERDLFRRRLDEGVPIGIHEFLYPLLQGWDSVEIRADIELGGTDQLFNLLVGRDLQEQEGQPAQVCLTTPLLLGLDGGQKMSKSLGNYIGLDFEATEVFGKVMSIPDALMRDWFILLTDLDEQRVEELLRGHPREAKARLAAELTRQLHGEEAAAAARERFDRVFRERETPEDVPEVQVPTAELGDAGLWVVRLVVLIGFAKSNGEARRLIQGRGLRIDGEVVTDVDLEVAIGEEGRLVQSGKRRFARVRVSD